MGYSTVNLHSIGSVLWQKLPAVPAIMTALWENSWSLGKFLEFFLLQWNTGLMVYQGSIEIISLQLDIIIAEFLVQQFSGKIPKNIIIVRYR